MEDLQGNMVYSKEEEIPVRITPKEYKKHERQLFAFQDILPIISGRFRLLFLIKNKTAKNFTSFQTHITIPEDNE